MNAARLNIALLGACAWMAALPVQAESMSLEQAIERAHQADHRIKEREHLVAAAQALLEEVKGRGGVMVGANAFLALAPAVNGGFYQDGAVSCSSNCRPRSDVYTFDTVAPWTQLSFTLIKPLYTFGKIERYSEAAQGNIDVKRGDVALQRGKTAMDVSQAYYGYLAAQEGRLMLEDVRGRMVSALTLVQQWLNEGEGDAKQSDLYALQTAMAMVDSYLAKARAVEQIAADGLRLLTGMKTGETIELADARLEPVPLPEQSQQALQQMALEQRPEMAQVEAGLRARRAMVEARQAERKPNLYAGIAGSLAYTPNRDRLNNPYVYDAFNHAMATPLVGVKWDFSSNVNTAQTAQAQAELDALLEKAAFARQGIPFEVAEAHNNARALNESVQLLHEGSRSARRWMISSYADFEAGLQPAEKVMTALQGYVLTYSEYLKTVYDYDMQVARLKLVTGEMK